MHTLRRTLEGFLVSSGFPRSLIYATFDDTVPPSDVDVEVILQGLLGSYPGVSASEARERLRDNWTWKVVLKLLLIFHALFNTPRASAAWLTKFLSESQTLSICQSFREGEGTDKAAESHSPLIRRYAAYLEKLSKEITKPSPWFTRDMRIENGMYRDRDHDEVFAIVQHHAGLLSSCLSPMILNSKIVTVVDFNTLTAAICIAMFKESLKLYALLTASAMELIDRYSSFHPMDLEIASKVYETYRSVSQDMKTFAEFVQSLPELVHVKLPDFKKPPPVLKLQNEDSENDDISHHSVRKDVSDKRKGSQRHHQSSSSESSSTSSERRARRERRRRHRRHRHRRKQENTHDDLLETETPQQQLLPESSPTVTDAALISRIPLPVYPHPTHASPAADGSVVSLLQAAAGTSPPPPPPSPPKSCQIQKLADDEGWDWLDGAEETIEVSRPTKEHDILL